MRPVTREAFAAHSGVGKKPWLIIDGEVYDVGAFLAEHPGGEAVLRNCIGQDASKVYHKAAHSHRAEAMMTQYLVGPLLVDPTEYVIFESEGDKARVQKRLLRQLLLQFLAFGLLALGVGAWVLPEAELVSSAFLALLLVAAQGGIAALFVFVAPASRGTSLVWPRLSVALVGYHVGALVAAVGTVADAMVHVGTVQPLPAGILELGVMVILVFEARRQASCHVRDPRCVSPVGVPGDDALEKRRNGYERCGLLPASALPLYAVAASWVLRGALRLLDGTEAGIALTELAAGDLAPVGGRMAGAVIFASAASAVPRSVAAALDKNSRCAMDSALVRALMLAGFLASILALALWSACPELKALTGEMLNLRFLCAMGAAAIVGLLALNATIETATHFSPAYSVRAGAFSSLGAWQLCLIFRGQPCFSELHWLALLGFLGHLCGLASSNRSALQRAAEAGAYAQVPSHAIGTQALWDSIRVTVATTFWSVVVLPITWCVTAVLPDELRVYACEIPVPKLGDGVELGVAAQFSGDRAAADGDEAPAMPGHFVCNVGQIANDMTATQRSLRDIQNSMNTLCDVWREFEEPWVKGLIANVVCVFPRIRGQKLAKEINLSVWESAQAAHEWYVKSKAHKKVLQQHLSGIYQTFGNLLASLQPAVPLRHRAHCRACKRPVESPTPGSAAPRICPVCSGDVFASPLF